MATLLETHGAIITLDYLPVGQAHNTLSFLHKYQGQSVDYALKYGGYRIVEDETAIKGYMSYLTVKGRRGYGASGFVVRTIEELQYVSLQEGGKLTEDYVFTDDVAAPMLSGIRAAIGFVDGALMGIRGELDSWVILCAQRFGLNPDSI